MKATNLILAALLSVAKIFCNSVRESDKQSDVDYYLDGYYWDLDSVDQKNAQGNYSGKLPEIYKLIICL